MVTMRRILIAWLAACAHAAPHRPGEEFLAGIRIVGNDSIKRDELVRGLALHHRAGEARDVDEYELNIDATRIAGAYQRRGFFSIAVRPGIERSGDAVTVVFDVVEGPRATTRVELTGLPDDVPADKARALVHLADGAPFDYDAFDDAKQPLLELVENAGYARARLDAGVTADRANALATARFAFDAGPRCTFGAVEIHGVDGALADAVRARIAFHAGDRYSREAISATQRAIGGMARFSTVRVAPDRDGDATTIVVKIDVAEGSRHELRFGVGFGLDPLNLTLRATVPQYTVVGWPTPLSTTSVDVKPGVVALRDQCGYDLIHCDYQFRGRVLGSVTRQDVLGRANLDADVQGGLDYLVIEAYTIGGGRLRTGISSPLGTPRVQAKLGYQLGFYSFSDIKVDAATVAQLGIDRVERLGALTQSLVVDLRDRPIEPRYGVYAEVRVAEGTRYVGGAYDYVQLTPEVRGFVPLAIVVLALRFRYGAITGDVPPTERFYGGGASSHRGFDERRLSPVANNSTIPIGGAGLIETGAELRAQYGKIGPLRLGETIFLDGGDVTASPGQLDVTNLHWAIGAGLRVLTPIGPVRLDVGYRLNRYGETDPQPNDRWHVFLGVGEAF